MQNFLFYQQKILGNLVLCILEDLTNIWLTISLTNNALDDW